MRAALIKRKEGTLVEVEGTTGVIATLQTLIEGPSVYQTESRLHGTSSRNNIVYHQDSGADVMFSTTSVQQDKGWTDGKEASRWRREYSSADTSD